MTDGYPGNEAYKFTTPRNTVIRIYEPEVWNGEITLPIEIGEGKNSAWIGIQLDEKNLRELLDSYKFDEFISD